MSGHQFSKVQVARPPRSNFDLSHDHKFSTDMGVLTPTLVQECIPGDTFNLQSESLLRFAPLVAPVMHKINVFMHYFFVPNRLVWSNWESFVTANNGGTVPGWPHMNLPGGSPHTLHNTLADYLGLPTRPTSQSRQMVVSAIPFAAYQCIYNEYYRDQNLQPPINYKLIDGANQENSHLFPLRRRSWQHDYFTSALPWAQKGAAVSIPIGSFPDVAVKASSQGVDIGLRYWEAEGGSSTIAANNSSKIWGEAGQLFAETSSISSATAATINDLRRAFRLQEWLEKMARGGSRYIEQILVHFGVTSSDSRLQRPEFIGGTRNPVIISEVLQTSESADTPQATMAGHGIAGNTGRRFKYTCEEHGYIIGIMSVMPTTAYQQGVPKHFLRRSYLDYAWPTFAHIGEQPILNQEIYHQGNETTNNEPFGYIPRYSEYRYTPSRVSAEFRNSLAFWHLGRIFSSLPALNSDFIQCTPRNDIFAVTTGQKLWCHVYHNVRARRALPRYGTPTL